MIVLGVDPGLSGAVVRLTENGNIETLPMIKGKVKAKGEDILWPAMVEPLESFCFEADHCFIEQVGAMPGQGRSSMFKFGYNAGGIYGMILMSKVPVTLVTPQRWKGALRLTRDKDVCRSRAMQLFPRQAQLFTRKKDDGVAEAALIAYYGWKELKGEW